MDKMQIAYEPTAAGIKVCEVVGDDDVDVLDLLSWDLIDQMRKDLADKLPPLFRVVWLRHK
jgi:hypothetical protein